MSKWIYKTWFSSKDTVTQIHISYKKKLQMQVLLPSPPTSPTVNNLLTYHTFNSVLSATECGKFP